MSGTAAIVGLIWIATSALFSSYANGLFLQTFRDPFSHTFVRFALSSGLGLAWAAAVDKPLLTALPRLLRKLFVPACLLLVANLLNSMSMLCSGYTLTYVVKGLIPLFTVILCRIRGQEFDGSIYISLLPICFGVGLASVTDIEFDPLGFFCALGSTLSQTMLNISSKERIHALGLSGMEAFFVMATLCAAMSAPLLVLSYLQADGLVATVYGNREYPWLQVVLMTALAYHVEYTLNFLFVALCSPLAFSVTDIVRRLATICCKHLLFAKPFALLNGIGVVVSLSGVAAYTLIARRVAQKLEDDANLEAESLGTIEDRSSEDYSWASNYNSRQPSRQESQHAQEPDGATDSLQMRSKVANLPHPSLSSQSPNLRAERSPMSQFSDSSLHSGPPSPLPTRGQVEWWLCSDDSSLGIAPQALCQQGVLRPPNRRFRSASEGRKRIRRRRTENFTRSASLQHNRPRSTSID